MYLLIGYNIYYLICVHTNSTSINYFYMWKLEMVKTKNKLNYCININ